MKTRIITLLLLLLLTLTMYGQRDSTGTGKKERKISLSGEIYDSFTKAKVKAFMTLMRTDSTVVDTMTCWTWGTSSYYEFNVPARNDDFIIHAKADGYDDTTMVYHLRHIARNNRFELPRMLIKKRQRTDDDIYKDVSLDGVVITGTKVKLAYRGDTLVYNASAFNMPEGSMLDGLIRQMPGAELKDNGDIYINGKKVDYLTLNGKDFFKGQNKVMLDNLPYYTVKELKVYDKSTKQSELIGHDVEKKDYVMDVQLKREYNRGMMGNVEAGAGTDERYLARIFGLYYDDHSRMAIFGNTNNVNENRQPGGEGDWSPSNMPEGLHATKQTGLHLETEDQDKNWEEELDATFEWTDADNLRRTTTERFATGGNILSGSEAQSRQKDFRISASNYFQMKKPFTLWGGAYLNYSNGHRHTTNQDSTRREALVNQTMESGYNNYRRLNITGNLGVSHKFDWGDYLRLYLRGSFSTGKPNESYSLNRTFYAQTDSTGLRHYYADNHSQSYSYEATFGYHFQMPNQWFISPQVSFGQNMDKTSNDHFRLDWLKEVAADKQQTVWLPSTREALMSVKDYDNSHNELALNRNYQGSVDITHADDEQYFTIALPISNTHERLRYNDNSLDTTARRSYTDFQPRIDWYRWGAKRGLNQLGYNMSITRPTLSSLLPVDDTTNPLVTNINNPELKPTLNHSFNVGLTFNNDSTRHFTRLWGSVGLTQHAVGTRTIYNTTTGAYTFTQDNINGNWNSALGSSYEQPLDSAKRLTLRQQLTANYVHSVDFPVEYVAASQEGQQSGDRKSTVHNWTLNETLSMEYQKDKLTVGIRGDVSWRRSTSTREDFESISAFDFNYGGHLRYTIPWLKLYVGTDIHMYSRRGYQSDMMNTDDLVWNAELSRSLFKEKLTLKLTAFDLLHQLSSKQYSVNAQGRTETWVNCIPRYVLLTMTYRFNNKPKKP